MFDLKTIYSNSIFRNDLMNNFKDCVCEKLKKIASGTRIRVYYFGGQVDIIFERVNKGCIEGTTLVNSQIFIDCRKIVGFSILPIGTEECIDTILQPGQSIAITSTSPTISVITFTARTLFGLLGCEMSVFVAGEELASVSGITTIAKNYTLNLNGSFPPSEVTLQNTSNCILCISNIVAT